MLTPQYREYFVQEVKAYAEGRVWSAGSFCLPGGFFASLEAEEFIVTPERVWTLGAGNGSNTTRWIYTNGSGHSAKEAEFAKWHGESIGFWNGDSGDPLYWNAADPRPWGTYLNESDRRYEQYRKARTR